MAYNLELLFLRSNSEKGDVKNCSSCLTITFISHASKLMLTILKQRLLPYMEREMPDVEAGCSKREEALETIWLIHIGYWSIPLNFTGKSVWVMPLDYSKAFNYIDGFKWDECAIRRMSIWQNKMVSSWQRCKTRTYFFYQSVHSIWRTYHTENWIWFRSFRWRWKENLWKEDYRNNLRYASETTLPEENNNIY